jgi:hypothetical protein
MTVRQRPLDGYPAMDRKMPGTVLVAARCHQETVFQIRSRSHSSTPGCRSACAGNSGDEFGLDRVQEDDTESKW